MITISIPKDYVDRVDEEEWEKPFDVKNEENISITINGYILHQLTF
jgi:hypothetical protein